MNNFFNLFSSVILYKDIKINNKNLLNFINDIKKNDKGRILSNEGGWQSNGLDQNKKELKELKENIIEEVKNYSNYVSLLNNKNYLQEIWVNINNYKDYNLLHNHPKSIISGSYYLKTPKNCGNIILYHPCNQMSVDWDPVIKQYNHLNSTTWNIPVEEGKLILFPSWLYHSVSPNLNKKEERISLAFNICEKKI